MSLFKQIFIASLIAVSLGTIAILTTMGPKVLGDIFELSNSKPTTQNLNAQILLSQQKLDSINLITHTYSQSDLIQHQLVEHIAEINSDNKIKMYSMPQNHSYELPNKTINTLQIELEGNFKQQLEATKKLETELDILPMISCEFFLKRKKNSNTLIGRYIFQYNSPKLKL